MKLWRLTLCRLPTAGGDVAGLPGLLGAVLELLDVVELLGVFGVVVVELPPDETFETESDTGNTVVCRYKCYNIIIHYINYLLMHVRIEKCVSYKLIYEYSKSIGTSNLLVLLVVVADLSSVCYASDQSVSVALFLHSLVSVELLSMVLAVH